MSSGRTRTTTLRTTISSSSSCFLSSPSKRRRVEDHRIKHTEDTDHVVVADGAPTCTTHDIPPLKPTLAEYHRWTFTRAAITPCFIRDVYEMRESGSRDMEFFWLGRIPCRTIRLVGLVVGASVWEKRTVYTIDDGTAVIDCAAAHSQAPPPSPGKSRSRVKPSAVSEAKVTGPSFADYLPRARTAATISTSSTSPSNPQPPPLPKPIARVGQLVQVVGRVVNRHDTRLILVDEISRCSSPNDEPNHWLNVVELHRTTYHPKEELPPFVPPPLPKASGTACYNCPASPHGSPSKHGNEYERRSQPPGTPASVRSSVASTNTSPSTVASTSSPASSHNGHSQSPVRLRHPARLHTRDLTIHTLRIYIKHYMDNAPPPKRSTKHLSRSRSISPSPSPRSSQARREEALETPTKSGRYPTGASTEKTPRPSRLRPLNVDGTLHASLCSDTETETEDESDTEDPNQVYGYTLSHLRRVPELSLLARRVVNAEAHRRAKEERKKAKADGGRSQGREKSQSSLPSLSKSATAPSKETTTGAGHAKSTSAEVKRLFSQAIRTLFQDGSIVLWDGPIRPLPAPALDPLLPSSTSFSDALWKANTSTSSSVSSHTHSKSSSRSMPSYDEWDDDDASLSEPEPGEEAYVPLTPAYFARVLERAITRIVAEASAAPPRPRSPPPSPSASDATPRPKPKAKAAPARLRGKAPSLIDRLRAQESAADAGAGPTAPELLAWLRNSDERWARVGLWSVEEALEWGKREGRLWCVGKGRWEVCG
ncbi:hypothetical protein C8Q77DRAFT_1279903 [Trametes polyzona]|nr:hypothetical protein C8Q77DRAFT_1279903 [Trametes polyzona]